MSEERLTQLDKLYQSVTAALDRLAAAVGLKIEKNPHISFAVLAGWESTVMAMGTTLAPER